MTFDNVNTNNLFYSFGTQSSSTSSSTPNANADEDDLFNDIFETYAPFPPTASSQTSNSDNSYKSTVRPKMTMSALDELNHKEFIDKFSEQLIPGFLNLDESDGWPVASRPCIAEKLIRDCILKLFNELSKEKIPESEFYKTILCSVYQGFPEKMNSLHPCSPQSTRVVQDVDVLGWNNHKVGRLVGNLGSSYNPSEPFFEVIVNSHTNLPFNVSIHGNEKVLNDRRTNLLNLETTPHEIALSIYFDPLLVTPEEFLKQNKLEPNSTRMIEGLRYLQSVQMPPQTVGNCWMKQPLRNFLAALYLETFSAREELTPKDAWKMALKLYKDVQMQGLLIIEKQLLRLPNSDLKVIQAWNAFERRRKLLQN